MRNIPFGKPVIGDEEKKAVCAVMDSGVLAHGRKISEFEHSFASFTGAPFAVGAASCTAALHLTYFSLEMGPGDEVIVPAQTHTATAHAVELTGAKPVFVDAEPDTGNIDINQIEDAVTRNTRAISVVHFLGMPVDMPRVAALARKLGLYLIEDCALAIGSYVDGTHAGLFGDAGCFSFYPVKHITTGEGGMLITNDRQRAATVARQRAFGMDKHVGERQLPGMYDVQGLGFNYRLNEIQAAIGIEQMKRLPQFLKKRHENYRLLTEGLRNISEISLLKPGDRRLESSHYCHTVLLDKTISTKRFDIINMLREQGVGTSIYYPCPVPLMTYYREKYGFKPGQFPVAERISSTSIALPVGPHVGPEDIDYMIQSLKNAIRKA